MDTLEELRLDFPLPSTSVRAAPSCGVGTVKRLSARHHRLAQCLAEGLPPGDAAVICGYSLSRVSILQTDPAFRGLISFYAAKRQEAFVNTGEKLAEVASTALDIIQDRLEDDPESFSTPALLSVATAALDRSGHGPSSTQRNVSVSVTVEELERLKSRVLDSQPSVKLIPAQPEGGGSGESGTASAPVEGVESAGEGGPEV